MRRHGLVLNDVEHFPTSTAARCAGTSAHGTASTAVRLEACLDAERERGPDRRSRYYRDFGDAGRAASAPSCSSCSRELKADGQAHRRLRRGRQGHARCSTTSGIGTDLVDYVVDRNVHKQGLLHARRAPADP